MAETIVLWGDSIGKGVIYNETRRRYCLAKDRCIALLQAAGLKIENNARMGATIGEGYRDFCETEAKPGDIVVIEYGGNDCDPDWDAVAADPTVFHDGKTPLPVFRDTLRRFILDARDRGLRPMAVVPPPLEADRYYRWVSKGRDGRQILRYLVDVQHIYRWQERYANAVREVARKLDCPVIDLREPFLDAADLPSLICEDGIHPNEAGQQLMARTIEAALARDEWREACGQPEGRATA